MDYAAVCLCGMLCVVSLPNNKALAESRTAKTVAYRGGDPQFIPIMRLPSLRQKTANRFEKLKCYVEGDFRQIRTKHSRNEGYSIVY